jgi:hypothetical protein
VVRPIEVIENNRGRKKKERKKEREIARARR